MIILSLSLSSHCQKWVSPTSEWEYTNIYGLPESIDYIKLTYEKDTILLNKSCKKVKNWTYTFFTYEQNDTAFVFLDGQFRASYYFNANVNDTLTFYITKRYNLCQGIDSNRRGKVDSITFVSFNAQPLKKWHVSMIDTPVWALYPINFNTLKS